MRKYKVCFQTIRKGLHFMFFETLIERNDLNRYTAFIPGIYREALYDGEIRATAVYNDIADPGHLVGVVLFRELYKWQQIIRIGLSSRYPFDEYASDIITMRTEAVRTAGHLSGTFASYPAGDEKSEKRFKKAGFSTRMGKGDSYIFTIYEVETGQHITRANLREAKAFSLLDKSEMEDFAGLIAEGLAPLPRPLKLESVEDSISCVVERDGRINSFILCRYEDGALIVMCMHAGDPKDVDILFTHLYFNAARKYGKELRIVIPAAEEELCELAKRFAPGAELPDIGFAFLQNEGSAASGISPVISSGESKEVLQDQKDEPGSAIRLGLGGIYPLTESDRGPGNAVCSDGDISRENKELITLLGEENFCLVRSRLEKVSAGKEVPADEKDMLFTAKKALSMYREGKTTERKPDGSEFIVKPPLGMGEDDHADEILSVMNVREELKKRKLTGKTAAEKAEDEYFEMLGDNLGRLIKTFFGSLGLSEDPSGNLSPEQIKRYRSDLPALNDKYLALLREKKSRIARGIFKRLTDSEEYKKAYSAALAAAISEETKKTSDPELARKRAGIAAQITAAATLPEFSDKELYMGLKDSLMKEFLSVADRGAGTAKAAAGEEASPAESRLEMYAPDLAGLAPWDKDGGGTIRTVVNYSIRNELRGYEGPGKAVQRSLEELYGEITSVREEYPGLFEALTPGNIFKDLTKMAECFRIVWEVRHVSLIYDAMGDRISAEDKLDVKERDDIEDIYKTLLKRGVAINNLASGSL